MKKGSLETDVNILLKEFRSYTFNECQDCLIYYKGSVLVEKELKKWFSEVLKQLSDNKDDFIEYFSNKLKGLSGLFAIVIKKGDSYFIAGDRIRSIPVFYGLDNGNLFITDKVYEYQKQHNHLLKLNEEKLEEFVSTAYVYGNGTVYNDVFALQAGEIVSLNNNSVNSERYFEFKLKDTKRDIDIKEFTKDFDERLLSAFRLMKEQSPDVNRWVVPLSGGHDSRLVVNYMYKLGFKNVVCFTYGTLNNEQSQISRNVAEALGYEWHFVEYTEEKWKKLHDIGLVEDFIWYTFNGVSTAHFQDILAIYEMKEKGVLKENDIFVPGHTLDWLVGSNFNRSDMMCNDRSSALDRVISSHTKIKNRESSPIRSLEKLYHSANVIPKYFQEYFNWQELRVKYTVNSLRGYEYFGFEARLPFWDKDVVEFWMDVPDDKRTERKIFHEAEHQGLLVDRLLPIPYFGKRDIVVTSTVKMEDALRKLLPLKLKTLLLRIAGRKNKFNAGLNQIYELKASTVKQILKPVKDFPENLIPYFKEFLNRYTHQMDYHFMTTLYTVRMLLDLRKKR